jgi:hypothetical protein
LSGSSKFLGVSTSIIYSVGFGKHQNFNGANMFSTLHLDGLHSLLYRQGKIINLCIQFYNILNEMGELLHYGQPNFKKKNKKKKFGPREIL